MVLVVLVVLVVRMVYRAVNSHKRSSTVIKEC